MGRSIRALVAAASILLLLLLAGCSSPPVAPRTWDELDDVAFDVTETVAGEARTYKATLRNDGDTSYYYDLGCGSDWVHIRIRSETGNSVFPIPGDVCDACPETVAFPPGTVLDREWTWDGTDGRADGAPRAAPGGYTTTISTGVLLSDPEHPPCERGQGVATVKEFTFSLP